MDKTVLAALTKNGTGFGKIAVAKFISFTDSIKSRVSSNRLENPK